MPPPVFGSEVDAGGDRLELADAFLEIGDLDPRTGIARHRLVAVACMRQAQLLPLERQPAAPAGEARRCDHAQAGKGRGRYDKVEIRVTHHALHQTRWFGGAVYRPLVAQPLDLVGEIETLVGRDPLQHPHPLLQPLGMRRILRGLLGGLGIERLGHFLLMLQPAAEHVGADPQDHWQPHHDEEEAKYERGLFHCGRSSVLGNPQRFDLAIQGYTAVGDDALDIRQTVLHRTDLGAKLGVLLADELDALDQLLILLGIHCLTPGTVEWVPILDAQPGGEHPRDHSGHADDRDRGGQDTDHLHLFHLPCFLLSSAQRVDLAGGAFGGVGGDALEHRDPLLQPADLSRQPLVLAGQQLDLAIRGWVRLGGHPGPSFSIG
ncbi:hypothetical protein DdX_21187 [Ditylenchus destructor]|uniref:Uncharacterized protein n=1 Tax=Ditylenchus destructor TaxID=166010 RepID=A0AAD4QVR8_9BILA|nr:hypothetical protein DdX_21187 [Ditylenchus destructor]